MVRSSEVLREREAMVVAFMYLCTELMLLNTHLHNKDPNRARPAAVTSRPVASR